MDQARKRAEAVVENADMSEVEKAQEMRKWVVIICLRYHV